MDPILMDVWTNNATLATAPPIAGGPAQPGGAPSEGAPVGPGQGGQPAQPPGFGNQFLLFIFLMFVVLILVQVFAGRKDKKRRAEMLANLKRYDKVQTVGGVIGTVSDVRDAEVIVKVDESNNTKIRFARSAIQQVLKSSASGGSEQAADVEPEKVGA
ncbi:MAG: preprotein translocase subunit YajC [Planctomycetota bacterium]|nr:preprotein translocase subunit YajC [Planctomycetota bacterium]